MAWKAVLTALRLDIIILNLKGYLVKITAILEMQQNAIEIFN